MERKHPSLTNPAQGFNAQPASPRPPAHGLQDAVFRTLPKIPRGKPPAIRNHQPPISVPAPVCCRRCPRACGGVRRPGWPSALATADVTPDESGCLTDGPRDVPAPVSSPPRRRKNLTSRPRPQRELPHPTPCDGNFNRPRDDILESDENKFPARDQAPTKDCPWTKGLQTDAGPTTPQHATPEPSP